MKYKKGAKVRVAAGGASVVADGTEGTVEEVRANAKLYRVAFAGGKSVLLAEDQVTEPETDEEKKKREEDEANAAADGNSDDELDENGEPKPKAKPKAEGEADDEELDENGEPKPKAKPATALTPTQLGAKAERTRVLGIQALAQPGEEAVVQACIDDPTCSIEAAALRLRQAQASKPAARIAALRRADGTMPKAGVGAVPTEKKTSPGAARVIAAIGRVFPQAKQS